MSNTQTKDITVHSLEVYTKEVVSHILDGWAISPSCPGLAGMLGGVYTVSLYRNAETVDNLRSKVGNVAELPKPTRAEILEKARAAKAAKGGA